MCGFIAQLVEHRTGIAEVTGSNPAEALSFSGFFFPMDRFHCHATKKNKLKTIQWKKLRNWDVVEDKKIRHFSKF